MLVSSRRKPTTLGLFINRLERLNTDRTVPMLITGREPLLQALSDLRQAIACVDLGLIGEDGIASSSLETNSSRLPSRAGLHVATPGILQSKNLPCRHAGGNQITLYYDPALVKATPCCCKGEHGFDISSAEGFTVIELRRRREFLRNARLGKNAAQQRLIERDERNVFGAATFLNEFDQATLHKC